ncbi:MAG: hypothetical protein CMP83_04785 [Gammaproteobacteria bacterium]|nr:hypothetical protein [Gammaproteobacteria bacterium]
MQGESTLTCLNHQTQAQEQRNIPVAGLADGAWLLVRGMRLWKRAFEQRTCIFAATQQDFSTHNCKVSVRYLDEMMCLFHVASHRPLVINSVTAQDATQDELIVVAALRLIADNRYEQASRQLRYLVQGPLNLSIIRVCADIAASFKAQQLSFYQKPYMALTNS